MGRALAFISFCLTILSIQSCGKDKETIPEKVNQDINIRYKVDGAPLIFDSIMYTNDAGNVYEVTRLEYYISNITFHSAYVEDYRSEEIFYINAMDPNTNILKLQKVPSGKYTAITFYVGIDTIKNLSYSLPNTAENINMAWPIYMGGGYHFLKLEGHYLFSPGTSGYAIHLGNNSSLVACTINKDFIVGFPPFKLNLEMNINEWYRSPILYDFSVDGSYIMGNIVAMAKIASNGHDVFTLVNN